MATSMARIRNRARRRHQGCARTHRFNQRQPKTFVARREGIDGEALVPALHFLDREFARDDDARGKPCGLDALPQITGEDRLLDIVTSWILRLS